jgi:hypothetical protein
VRLSHQVSPTVAFVAHAELRYGCAFVSKLVVNRSDVKIVGDKFSLICGPLLRDDEQGDSLDSTWSAFNTSKHKVNNVFDPIVITG